MTIEFPSYVSAMLYQLHKHGFDAYAVGGCIRDSLLHRTPNDWDITTSARPEETAAAFDTPKFRVYIGTGLRHGTVTVSLAEDAHASCEITTYRTEGIYTDHRRPDSVHFVRTIQEDLARRDFTVNAMAAAPTEDGVDFHDPFGGQTDLTAGILRCVGEAKQRFTEDALRILRGMRFAARYGFTIESATAAAMDACAPLLIHIAPERIGVELTGLLAGVDAGRILSQFPAILRQILPGCTPEDTHALFRPEDPQALRLALLCRHGDADTIRATLLHLALGIDTADRVVRLVAHQSDDLSTHKARCIVADRFGQEGTLLYLQFRQRLAPHDPDLDAHSAAIRALFAPGICYNTATLAIGGRELIRCGLPSGPMIGDTLRRLTQAVIAGEADNDAAVLCALVKQWQAE